ncbi:MAG: LPS ABC transporter substrate-binding protein LptA [Hyphomicrobiales bacterium]|nr:LPS ABC transporter substrate-binding protein LptA [Hyphomicrobiales bacterium]
MRRASFLLAISCGLLAGASMLAAGPALAQQNGSQAGTNDSFSGMKLSGDKPIQIESDNLEVHDKDNTAIFTGNVNVVQGTTLLKAGRMIVYYLKGAGGTVTGGSGNIKSIDVDGKVYVKSNDQIATGDHGTFDMQTQVLVLEGNQVVLTQGDNVVMGCKLTANLKTGLSKLDGCDGSKENGRVKVLLTPDKKKAAK